MLKIRNTISKRMISWISFTNLSLDIMIRIGKILFVRHRFLLAIR